MTEPDKTTAVAVQQRTSDGATELDRLLAKPFTAQDLMRGDNLDRLERIAERMAQGRMTVPEYLRGNVGDCMAIAMQAMLWGMDPFAVAQKTHIVSGRLGYEAQLVNAVVQNSGAIRGVPYYEYRGDGESMECRVGCVLRGESEIRWGEWLSIASVKTKNSPLWNTNPKLQMGYLQLKNWARAHVPGAPLGVYTTDELEDAGLPPPPAASSLPPAKPAQPAWPDDAFAARLPKWKEAIAAGKTPGDIIAFARSKGTLTEAQEAQIRALKPDEPEPPAQPAPAEVDPFIADYEAAAERGST